MHLCPAFVILKNSYEIQYVKKKKKEKHVSVFSSQNSIEAESCADLSTWKQPLVSGRTRYFFDI